MNKRIVIGIAIMAMAATAVQAVIFTTTAGGDWLTPATWNSTTTPGATVGGNDIARITGSSTVTLAGSVAQPMGNVQIGRTTAGNLILNNGALLTILSGSTLEVGTSALGTLVMNGGSVTGGTFTVGVNSTAAGSSATIHGGTMNFSGTLTVGKNAAGSLTMDGGSVLVNKFSLGDTANLLNGSAALTGGAMELGSGGLFINTPSTLTMGNAAQLIMLGDTWSTINDYVNSSDIVWANTGSGIAGVGLKTWDNGSGSYLHTDYDALTGKTTVWLNQTIPEPATVGMLGLGSLIVLLVRRMRG